jgi:hypothetical protein
MGYLIACYQYFMKFGSYVKICTYTQIRALALML